MYPLTSRQAWPALVWDQWNDTGDTLHMFLQMVGKTRTALTPVQNHWWNVPLYVSARGLTTSAMPLASGGLLELEFDFIAHQLLFRLSSGQTATLALEGQTVAEFFARYTAALVDLGVEVHLDPMPVELQHPIRFDQDTTHSSYDRDAVERFWTVLANASILFERFSTNFYGKISPVHFFWGSFDLAVTRFNGKRAPARSGVDAIQSEAYSHECISAGFWPGNGGYGQSAFYAYAAPVPAGLAESVLSSKGGFSKEMGEFLLNYDDVRASDNPAQTVLDFLESTYSAAANAAGWDRASLDRTDRVGEAAVLFPPR